MKTFSKIYIISVLLLFSCKQVSKSVADSSKKVQYMWEETEDHLALIEASGEIIWQLNYDKEQDKPYFHPLRTPKGYDLTLERPEDHPWHRGLWFSWKDINGVNYWEEDPEKGLADGRSVIKEIENQTYADFSAKITIKISYEENGQPIILEHRIIEISSPNGKSEYGIFWNQNFEFQNHARLYLEKPAKHGGEEWGGYAGLSFRGSEKLVDPSFLAASGWTNQSNLTGYGEKEIWMDVTSKIEGTDDYAGITIFDNPENPRFPSPYYIWFEKGKHTFFTPSLLFDGPMNFKVGEPLNLKYFVLIHDGQKSKEELDTYNKEVF